MTSFTTTLVIITLGFILFVYGISALSPKRKQKQMTPIQQMRAENLMETLEWMYIMGILSTKEYNDLLLKCLPYTK